MRILRVRNSRFSKKSLLGRVCGLCGYLLLAAWAAFAERRPDVLVVETDPPLLGALGALLKGWHRCGFIYYLQDLYPEVGLALGSFRPGLLTWLLHGATQFGLRQADTIVVLGEDMRRRVLERGIAREKIVIIPNWVDAKRVRPEWGLERIANAVAVGRLVRRDVLRQPGTVAESRANPARRAATERRSRCDFSVRRRGSRESTAGSAGDGVGAGKRVVPAVSAEGNLSESLGVADVHLIPLQKGLAG